jgi:hypothetical protein
MTSRLSKFYRVNGQAGIPPFSTYSTMNGSESHDEVSMHVWSTHHLITTYFLRLQSESHGASVPNLDVVGAGRPNLVFLSFMGFCFVLNYRPKGYY